MSHKLSITNLKLKGKKVLMRIDFNVPLDAQGNITDDTRIKASLPSIKYILEQGGALILMSHLGRPKGTPESQYSLAPCAKRLLELLNKPVKMAPECVGPAVEQLAKNLKPGEVLLLENLRFHRGEEYPGDDPGFAKQLANLGEIYVNDAFGTSHRSHSSISEVPKYFPGKAVAGFLLEKEIKFLEPLLQKPSHPFYAIIGGAKVSTKIGVLKTLIKKVDALFIGGGMAYTFFKAQGIEIGDSIHEDSLLKQAREILELSKSTGVKVFLPSDIVIVQELSNEAPMRIVSSSKGIPNGWQGVDIGPRTCEEYVKNLKNGSTIFWNGPLGIFEISNFAKGTNAIAEALASMPSNVITIIGGGESVAAIEAAGFADKMTHISTGGGAALEYIEFGTLPGIEALSENNVAVELSS
jgi:phosphoglycerate kinase